MANNQDHSGSPRILVIHTDEQHHRHLGCANDELPLSTPRIDELAQRGTRFTRTYAAAGVCVPSRASMMTGRYPIGHGVMNNQVTLPMDEQTMGSYFGNSDYATGYFGKGHYGRDDEDPQAEGWDTYFNRKQYNAYLQQKGINTTWPEGKNIDQFDVRYWTIGRSRIPTQHYYEPVVTDKAIEFMEQNRDGPFMCFVSLMAPHGPFSPPGEYASMYDPANMPLTERREDELAGKSPQARKWIEQNQQYLTQDELRIWTATTFGLISMVDHCTGQLLDALERMGIREQTMVIFTSDHGDFATRYGIIGKSWVQTDDLMRIPMIIDCPGTSVGQTYDGLTQNVDLLPTMLDYAGLDIHAKIQGQSLLPILRDQGGSLNRPAFAYDQHQYSGGASYMSMMVDGPWKYVHQSQGWSELYHLEHDPGECVNLIDSPDASQILPRLREKMLDWHVGNSGRPYDPANARFWEDQTLFYDAQKFNGERQPKPGNTHT